MTALSTGDVVGRLHKIARDLGCSFSPTDHIPAAIEDALEAIADLATELGRFQVPRGMIEQEGRELLDESDDVERDGTAYAVRLWREPDGKMTVALCINGAEIYEQPHFGGER